MSLIEPYWSDRYRYEKVYVVENDKGEKQVNIQERYVKKGDEIYMFHPAYVTQPTRTSIQAWHKHFEDELGQYLNHHCKPNAKIVVSQPLYHGVTSIMLVALKRISFGYEVTFDYRTTETKLSHPFKCKCHGKWIR